MTKKRTFRLPKVKCKFIMWKAIISQWWTIMKLYQLLMKRG